MRNKKLFIFISIVLVLSLVFAGCGGKSDIEDGEIEDENIVAEIENIYETKDDNGKAEDVEKIEDRETPIDIRETIDNKSQDESTSNKAVETDKKLVEEKPKTNTLPVEKSSPAHTGQVKNPNVTISIIGSEDVGTILSTTEVGLNDGDTVFDILKQVTKDNNIQMEYKGRKSSIYIQGIDNIYEFDDGPESGWIFRVNGEISQVSSSNYKLNDGDNIEWLYTIDLGREF